MGWIAFACRVFVNDWTAAAVMILNCCGKRVETTQCCLVLAIRVHYDSHNAHEKVTALCWRVCVPCPRYPDELLQYLRLIQLNKEQLLNRSLEDLDFDRKQTDVNELMVLDSLIDACNATLAGYPTTVSYAILFTMGTVLHGVDCRFCYVLFDMARCSVGDFRLRARVGRGELMPYYRSAVIYRPIILILERTEDDVLSSTDRLWGGCCKRGLATQSEISGHGHASVGRESMPSQNSSHPHTDCIDFMAH